MEYHFREIALFNVQGVYGK